MRVNQEDARARFQSSADCWDEVEDEGAENRMHRAGSEKLEAAVLTQLKRQHQDTMRSLLERKSPPQ